MVLGRLARVLLTAALGVASMVVLGTVAFLVAVFVVSTGAGLAGAEPAADALVLSSSLIVVAVILAGALTPRMVYAGVPEPVAEADEVDSMYG